MTEDPDVVVVPPHLTVTYEPALRVARTVHDTLAHETVDELRALRADLNNNLEALLAHLAKDPEQQQWARQPPWAFAILVGLVVGMLLLAADRAWPAAEPPAPTPPAVSEGVEPLSDEDLERAVRQAMRQQEDQPPDGRTPPPVATPPE